MKKPAWRTVISVLSLAAMGGAACVWVHGPFADYASLLKYLGWAVAVKSAWEHHVSTRPEATKP